MYLLKSVIATPAEKINFRYITTMCQDWGIWVYEEIIRLLLLLLLLL